MHYDRKNYPPEPRPGRVSLPNGEALFLLNFENRKGLYSGDLTSQARK